MFQSQSNQEEDIGILQLEKENVRKEDKVKERGLITPKKKRGLDAKFCLFGVVRSQTQEKAKILREISEIP